MLLTQELRKKLADRKNKLWANIFWQATSQNIVNIGEDIDLKIVVNGEEIENPMEYMERMNSLIGELIDNIDEEVNKAAKELIKEKYNDLYIESMQLSRKIEELQNDISWKMDNR
ncbi:hypothetical protein AM596_15430 [Clostridium perfringens CP4]|uniref:hypothetical protein n=1 Tax=Clostridium perfringens TaxID=1502 RepID=UPI0007076FD0|nr:hypothetical protein [Clostridium perfringens]KQC91319.1 hypothetical protein AM596_15430 [Clostridium perfringens CP4]